VESRFAGWDSPGFGIKWRNGELEGSWAKIGLNFGFKVTIISS